jgi:hypothetical protein
MIAAFPRDHHPAIKETKPGSIRISSTLTNVTYWSGF